MTIETIKRMLDACYQGKRIRDMLPPLPKGVTSSYIQYLDVIQSLERNGVHVKISPADGMKEVVIQTTSGIFLRFPIEETSAMR